MSETTGVSCGVVGCEEEAYGRLTTNGMVLCAEHLNQWIDTYRKPETASPHHHAALHFMLLAGGLLPLFWALLVTLL